MRWVSETRERLRGVLFKRREDAETQEELRFHLEMEADRLVRQEGLDPVEAKRRAAIAFGGVEKYREEVRDARGLAWLGGMSLDLKLGARMLFKYPGLTLVGGLAMAFAIWVGAGAFEFISQVVYPTLPLEQGERVVSVMNRDAVRSRSLPPTLHDFVTWRDELTTIEGIGAFRSSERNLITPDGNAAPVPLAEISASAFTVARVRPLMGRALMREDESPTAAPVAVIGHDLWQGRFGADPAILGKDARLGGTTYTIVGVMPEGFAFPVSQSLWVPLRLNVLAFHRGAAPSVTVFGRLAPGASMEEAQAELSAVGRRTAIDFPETHEHLRPKVMEFARSYLDLSLLDAVWVMSANLFLLMLLVLVAGNVALLMFARAATREAEIAVRNALGASRRRIVLQLFAEAFVLAGLAAAIGLATVSFGMRWAYSIVQSEMMEGGRLPFWFSDSLSPATVVYALLLTFLAAIIAGVVPGMKVTRGLGTRLRQGSAGGGGFRFGGIWTAVIVAQVAVTVAFPMVAYFVRRDAVEIRNVELGFPAEEYLSLKLGMDREVTPGVPNESAKEDFQARYQQAAVELERRLEVDPRVAAVTFAERLPLMYHPHRRVEVDEGMIPSPDSLPGHRVSSARVAPDYFETLSTPIISGRGFDSGDLGADARAVIVNQSFVKRVLGGKNPIGRRIRHLHFEEWEEPRPDAKATEPWYEIVGVVQDLGMSIGWDAKIAGFYHPVASGAGYPLSVAIRVRGEPEAIASDVVQAATAVDPTLQVHEMIRMDQLTQAELRFYSFWFWMTLLVSTVALVLSLAGIYAVMSFTVSQRTREIGIRVALGGSGKRVIVTILRRPLIQIALGILVGSGLVTALFIPMKGAGLAPREIGILAGYSAVMMGVCLLACVVPTRRAMMVEPTVALKSD